MRIACIGNYPPRECGIATFSSNFTDAILDSDGRASDESNEMYIIAMNDPGRQYDYPDIVVQSIHQNELRDYQKAAGYINSCNTDVCFLQHEFGIYGGNRGVYILSLLHQLKVPFIPIFHTVLKKPSEIERNIIMEISRKAVRIVVMNRLAIGILNSVYRIPEEQIAVIPHGVPVFNFSKNLFYKKYFHLEGRKILMTFGLISRNKSLETVINALPEVVGKHPDLLYLIVGKTHPAVVQSSGEEYREYLESLIEKNRLEDNVVFINRFLSTDELLGYLSATDLYVTPYLNEAQITSGTLSYAIGAGAAVISTPYLHAKELLSEGRGMLFDFNDSAGLADILNDLLDHPDKLRTLRKNAFEFGKKTSWPQVGKLYLDLSAAVVKSTARTDISVM